MKRLINYLLLVTLAIGCTTNLVFASERKPVSPNWDHFEIGYLDADIDGLDASPTGFGSGFTTLLSKNVFIRLNSYLVTDTFRIVDVNADLDVSQSSIGLGYKFAASGSTDLFIAANYVDAEVCVEAIWYGTGCDDENGHSIEAGIRSMVTNQVEMFAKAASVDLGDGSDTVTTVGLVYDFQNNFAIKFELSNTDDVDMYGLGMRYMF